MHCQACGFENASGIKFCGECGSPLKLKCSSCGFENAPAIKFCGECGRRLDEPLKPSAVPDPRTYTPKHLAQKILTSRSALEGERKQVTVLATSARDGHSRQVILRHQTSGLPYARSTVFFRSSHSSRTTISPLFSPTRIASGRLFSILRRSEYRLISSCMRSAA